ncbi:MAG TPA: hypothetical protein VFN25_00295 [Dokdonella sp.]|uniref:hypothetical protein n=1 Tax=Dokdonella sp. TaxID=2291710 RepID=UPI002D7E737A|nr:hypothetical protein [Dokdonella sp.]HET9031321.1 hypothetical protein [Dokdonella sp.]
MKSQSFAAALLYLLGGSMIVSSAAAAEIYSNGPFVTNPGAHVSGADVSLAQDVTYPGYNALGFNAGPGYRLADDFIVPANHFWTIDSAVLYAYQTGTGDADFTDVRLIIWQGPPDGFNSIKKFDGSVSNNLVSSTPGAYRTAQSFGATQFSDDQRRIKSLLVAIPELELGPGQYWMDWQLKGPMPTDHVFTPPVSILGQAYTSFGGFARRKCPAGTTDPQDPCTISGPGWFLFENGSSPNLVDLPFKINGTDVANLIFANGFEALPATP